MAKYTVIRIAVDMLGQPISATLEHVHHGRPIPEVVLDVDPFEGLNALWERVTARLDKQLTLW